MRFVFLPACLLVLVSCSAYKLHVRLDGRPTTSMEARLAKVNGIRTVDLFIPSGLWAVSSNEPGLNPRILKTDGRQHVRFEVPPDRMLSIKPVELMLQGLDLGGKPSGIPFTVTIDHYTLGQKASSLS